MSSVTSARDNSLFPNRDPTMGNLPIGAKLFESRSALFKAQEAYDLQDMSHGIGGSSSPDSFQGQNFRGTDEADNKLASCRRALMDVFEEFRASSRRNRSEPIKE